MPKDGGGFCLVPSVLLQDVRNIPFFVGQNGLTKFRAPAGRQGFYLRNVRDEGGWGIQKIKAIHGEIPVQNILKFPHISGPGMAAQGSDDAPRHCGRQSQTP